MNSSSTSIQMDKVRDTLDSLPIEVFLMICDYLDADTLLRSLIYVNKHFYGVINDVYLWKKRIGRKFKDCDTAFMMTNSFNENSFNWKKFTWHTELEEDCWRNYNTKTTTTIFEGTHFSEVDAIIMTKDGNHCISASRDRSMCLWDVRNMVTNPVVHKVDGHTGWIWDLRIYDENSFLSCSWDSKIKLWNMDSFSQDLQPIRSFTADSAVLSIACKENCVAAGLYTPKIVAFDPREYKKRLFELNPHTRSIIELCLVEDYYLVSLSEDRTLSVWDLRTLSSIKSMYLAKDSNRFPMCASYYDNVLFVGDNQDYMYWLDCSHGLFNILETVKIIKPMKEGQRNYKLNSVKCTNYGSIITGGNEGVIYIISPTNPPKVIAKIDTGSEITSIDYQNNTLVAGYVNSEIQVWKKN